MIPPVLDLACGKEGIVSLHLIYIKVTFKLQMTHLRPALIYVESLQCEEPKRTLACANGQSLKHKKYQALG